MKINEYLWKAQTHLGQKQQGKLLASSHTEAEQILQKKGLNPLKIQRNFTLPIKPKKEEITALLSQIALLLNAALPLKQCLHLAQENCLNIPLYQWLQQLNQLLLSGYRFSEALSQSTPYLTNQEINLIRIGERTGKLAEILQNITLHRQKIDALNRKVKKILFYPLFILAISLLLSLALLIFIVPQFAELYATKSQNLPIITQLLFYFSTFLQQHFRLLFFTFLFGFILCYWAEKNVSFFQQIKFYLLSHLPIFQNIIKQKRIIFFCHQLALMLNASLRLDVALNTLIDEKNGDPVLYQEIQFLQQNLKQGYRFAQGLNPMIFGNENVQMLMIAEQSGRLSEMFDYIAQTYQQKLDHQIEILSQLLEPVLMLFIGTIIGVVILGLYLPIFEMGAILE